MRNIGKPRLLNRYLRIIKQQFSNLRHKDFIFIWIVIISLFLVSLSSLFFDQQWHWITVKTVVLLTVILTTILFLFIPMNAVYGLMGTSGSVRVFFSTFIVISFLFSMIYYCGFFHNAAVSYDVNQPHIYYNCPDSVLKNGHTISETTLLVHVTNNGTEVKDSIYQIQEIKYNYQCISFWDTFRNTIMTTLMQEPTDFFAIASTHNEAMDKGREFCLDKDKAAMFHWLLIIQILISWIFFGVFISILYNKFRYES